MSELLDHTTLTAFVHDLCSELRKLGNGTISVLQFPVSAGDPLFARLFIHHAEFDEEECEVEVIFDGPRPLLRAGYEGACREFINGTKAAALQLDAPADATVVAEILLLPLTQLELSRRQL